jgi:hypothetical protein
MNEDKYRGRENLTARAWALLLIARAEAAGLCPLSRARFHGSLYLAFALARIYDVPALSSLVLRDTEGPLYPHVHREVGRLILSGLVSITDYRPHHHGALARSAGFFRITRVGKEIADEIMLVPRFEAIGKLLADVAFGLAELDYQDIDSAVRADPTYAQLGKSMGHVIRFDELEDNHSAQAAAQIAKRLSAMAPPSMLDVVATFAEVLCRRAAA